MSCIHYLLTVTLIIYCAQNLMKKKPSKYEPLSSRRGVGERLSVGKRHVLFTWSLRELIVVPWLLNS